MDKSTESFSKKEANRQKRAELRQMSAMLKPLIESGAIGSINEGLINIYRDEGHSELKTFEQWKKEGKRVKKGEKALLLWGRPKKMKQGAQAESGTAHGAQATAYGTNAGSGAQGESEAGDTYFPLCYVFSDKQVREPGARYKTINAVRLVREKSDIRVMKIGSSEDVDMYVRQFYGDDIDIYESTWALFLDRQNKTIGYAKISQGGISGTVVDVRLILKYALDCLASGIILVHNHPSGNNTTSQQDDAITRKLREACKWMDVTLLDHIVLAGKSYYSYADNGKLGL